MFTRAIPRFVTACLFAAGVLIGCDDDAADRIQPTIPDTKPPELKPQEPQPTTQALLSGPRRELRLGVLPISMRVPEGFAIVKKMAGGTEVRMLEGFAPSGRIGCRLTELPSTTADDIKLTLERLGRERARLMPGETMRTSERDGMKIVEQRGPAKESPTAATQPSDPYAWRVTFYTPDSVNYGVCEVSFLGLNVEQLQQDEAFFRSLVDSAVVTKLPIAPDKPADPPVGGR